MKCTEPKIPSFMKFQAIGRGFRPTKNRKPVKVTVIDAATSTNREPIRPLDEINDHRDG